MKAMLWGSVVTLALLVLPGQAPAACWPNCGTCGLNCEPWFHLSWHFGPHVQLGPWYHYYPYEAYFQTPAPVGPFPNWQSPVTAALPVGPVLSAPPAIPAPAPAVAPWQPPAPQPVIPQTGYLQPAAYSHQQVPSYWYGQR